MEEKLVKKMNPYAKDVLGSAIMAGIFLLFFIFSFNITVKNVTGAVSSKTIPQVISFAGTILCVVLMVKNYLTYRSTKNSEEDSGELVEPRRWLMVIVSVVLIVAYVALIRTLGFIIASALYLFVQMIVITEKPTKKTVILLAVIAIAVPVILFVPFRFIFKLMIPMGTIFG